MKPSDELYIGWEPKSPPGIRSVVRRAAILLVAVTAGLAVLLALAQHTIGTSVFEWGAVKQFSGVFQSRPCPCLLVPRPGASPGQSAFSAYYLVKPFKHGIDAETASRLDGESVTLKGTLIYRESQTMIEVADITTNSVLGSGVEAAAASFQPADLGRQTLVGAIVDCKCYFGVMNPGELAPHRACAIRCLSGGIPPVFLVRPANGPPLYFLLVSADGHPVNQQILDLVAEPVKITGEVFRQGDLLVLRSDPATYRRIAR